MMGSGTEPIVCHHWITDRKSLMQLSIGFDQAMSATVHEKVSIFFDGSILPALKKPQTVTPMLASRKIHSARKQHFNKVNSAGA